MSTESGSSGINLHSRLYFDLLKTMVMNGGFHKLDMGRVQWKYIQ